MSLLSIRMNIDQNMNDPLVAIRVRTVVRFLAELDERFHEDVARVVIYCLKRNKSDDDAVLMLRRYIPEICCTLVSVLGAPRMLKWKSTIEEKIDTARLFIRSFRSIVSPADIREVESYLANRKPSFSTIFSTNGMTMAAWQVRRDALIHSILRLIQFEASLLHRKGIRLY